MILDQAFRYITELKKQNDAMLLEGGDKVQGSFNTSSKGFNYTMCALIFTV